MSDRKVSSVADFLVWHQESQQARQRHANHLRSQMEQGALCWVKREMQQGYSIQEAGDRFVRAMKHLRVPTDQGAAAIVALSQIGWQPKRQGGAK